MEYQSDLTWMIGGPQGGGINSAAESFAKALARGGYRICMNIEYHSNIQGEHAYYKERKETFRKKSTFWYRSTRRPCWVTRITNGPAITDISPKCCRAVW